MRLALLALTVAVLGSVPTRPAWACINDRETPRQEREFRSNYGDPEPSRPQAAPKPPPLMASWSAPVLTSVGVVLLTGAGFLALLPRAKG